MSLLVPAPIGHGGEKLGERLRGVPGWGAGGRRGVRKQGFIQRGEQ